MNKLMKKSCQMAEAMIRLDYIYTVCVSVAESKDITPEQVLNNIHLFKRLIGETMAEIQCIDDGGEGSLRDEIFDTVKDISRLEYQCDYCGETYGHRDFCPLFDDEQFHLMQDQIRFLIDREYNDIYDVTEVLTAAEYTALKEIADIQDEYEEESIKKATDIATNLLANIKMK